MVLSLERLKTKKQREAAISASQHWRLKSWAILKRGICFQFFPSSSIIETETQVPD